MRLCNVAIIGRYESRIFIRSWIFRILGIVSWGGVSFFILRYFTDYLGYNGELGWRSAVSSHVPYMGMFLYSMIQAVAVVFWSGNFLARNKKMDTLEVIYVRPITNADYVVGKIWGVVKVLFLWNIVILLWIALLHGAVIKSPFSIYPYFLYLFSISMPSLLFVLGLSYLFMCLLKTQAIAYAVLLGLVGILFFFAKDLGHGLLDLFCMGIPAILSDITGHADLSLFLWQRLIFCLAGIALICLTIACLERLPHRKAGKMLACCWGGGWLVVTAAVGFLYAFHFERQNRQRDAYAEVFNQYAGQPHMHIVEHELKITPKGEELEGFSALTVRNDHSTDVSSVLLYLNPALKVGEIRCEGKELNFERDHQLIRIEKKLQPGEETHFTLSYAGEIDETICYLDVKDQEYWDNAGKNDYLHPGKRYVWLEEDFTLLTPECLWYPVAVAPVCPEALYHIRKDFTDYRLSVCYDGQGTVLSQGSSKREGDWIVFHNSMPLSGISLTIADYERKALQVDSVLYEILYFPGHDIFSSSFVTLRDSMAGFIREVKSDIERHMNQAYPYSKFVLAETPAQHVSYLRSWKGTTEQVLPEIMFLPERGYSLNIDFERTLEAEKNLPIPQMNTPEFLEHKVLYRFITRNFAPSGNLKDINPWHIFPMFKQYTQHLYSAQYPVLDVVFNKLTEEKQRAIALGINQCINDRQRANYYLGEHSLQAALTDQRLKPEVLNELLAVKAEELKNYIGLYVPVQDFQDFLNDYMKRYRFQNTTFENFEEEFSERYRFDFEKFLEKWYHSVGIPSLIFGKEEIYKVTGIEEEKYQTRVHVYNPSEVDALLSLFIYGYDRSRRESEEYQESFYIPAGKAYELRLTTYIPALNGMITAISSNIPSDHYLSLGRDYKETRDTAQGAFEIDPALFAPDPQVIIVDNEDPGFQTVDQGKSHRLKNIFQQGSEEKYQPLNWVSAPVQWTATADINAYGESVRSAVYKKSGEGYGYAVWNVDIIEEGYYEIGVWNANMGIVSSTLVINGEEIAKERIQTYEVAYGEEKEIFSLNLFKEEKGWIVLGTFYLPSGRTTVKLTDKSPANFVVADAVKFTKIK